MAQVTLRRKYELECAHQLTGGLPENHRCRRLHGHRYEVQLHVNGIVDEDGVLIEYADLDSVVWPVLRLADHYSLNTIAERCSTAEAVALGQNPTVERLAVWIGMRLETLVRSAKADGQRLRLIRVEVQEDSRSGADWEPQRTARVE